MKMSAETLEKIRQLVETALTQIGASEIEKKIRTALRFATSQASQLIDLDGNTVEAVTVDIASVFTREAVFCQITDANGIEQTVELMEVVSIVITAEDVHLCKSTFHVLYDPVTQKEQYINAKYRTVSPADLTDTYCF